eukprot:g20377.t1
MTSTNERLDVVWHEGEERAIPTPSCNSIPEPTSIPTLRGRAKEQVSPDTEGSEPIKYVAHIGGRRAYVRDVILGVNDGLVSMFLLVVGVVGGGMTAIDVVGGGITAIDVVGGDMTAIDVVGGDMTAIDVVGGGMTAIDVLLTAIAGALAGAISMGLGEFVATKSQREVTDGQLALEKVHLKHFRAQEIDELRDILQKLSLKGELLERVVDEIGKDDDALLKVMCAFEFGISPDDQRNPLHAMLYSGVFFLGGSIPSWIPFVFTSDINLAVVISAVLSGLALFTTGAIKSISTRGNPWTSGLENLVLGAIGAGVSYGVGCLYLTWAKVGPGPRALVLQRLTARVLNLNFEASLQYYKPEMPAAHFAIFQVVTAYRDAGGSHPGVAMLYNFTSGRNASLTLWLGT